MDDIMYVLSASFRFLRFGHLLPSRISMGRSIAECNRDFSPTCRLLLYLIATRVSSRTMWGCLRRVRQENDRDHLQTGARSVWEPYPHTGFPEAVPRQMRRSARQDSPAG